MSEPRATENVIALRKSAGRVTVHGWRKQGRMWDVVTDCQRAPEWNLRSWLWVQFRTLNPGMVDLCKKCWADPIEEER